MPQRPTLKLAKQLISRKSITPSDAGCQAIIAARLEKIGFKIEHLSFGEGNERVDNLWARRGTISPLLAFAGHTDVVPEGDREKWQSDPYKATEKNGFLYGRGAADMKSSLAAFVTSIEAFVTKNPEHQGSIAVLLTSDEEGIAKYGTVKVIETLEARNEKIDFCIVGEPSSTKQLGDTIKNGRRGSLGCQLTITGKQGHVAYPHLAINPIHITGQIITQLNDIEWDLGNDYFPPTSFQISNINSGTGATNVIPESAHLIFNFRFSTETNAEKIQHRVETTVQDIIKNTDAHCDYHWHLSGNPFITNKGELINACQTAIQSTLGIETKLSTGGGTSDGRFIAPTGAQLVEFGPINASIHQINEHVLIEDIEKLSHTYEKIMSLLLT